MEQTEKAQTYGNTNSEPHKIELLSWSLSVHLVGIIETLVSICILQIIFSISLNSKIV